MARRIEVQITGNSSDFERALASSSGSARTWGATVGRTVARGALAAGAAIGGLAGVAVKSAIDFESSFAGVRKTVNASEKDLDQLAKGFLDLSRRIPVNVNELNRIGEAAGQLGIQKKNILEFTETIAKLGVSSNLAGEEGAAMLARFANITRMPTDQFDNLGATIVALGNAGASTEKEIAEMALRLGAAATQVGMTQPQILGLANALSSVGIEAEAGGTAMSTAMIRIEEAVRAGGDKLAGFARVAGMSADAFAAKWRANPSAALIDFVEGLDRVKKSGGDVFGTLDKLGLGGIRVRDALLRSAGAGDLLRKSLALGEKAWKDNLALNKEAEQRFKTTASQLALLKNNINAIAIVVGSTLLPAFNRAVLAVTGFASKVFETRGIRAKLNVVWEGAQEAAAALYGKIRAAVAAIDWQGLFLGVQGIGESLAASIAAGVAGVDWTATGKGIIAGITAALQGASELANALGQVVRNAAAQVNWAELGKVMGPALLTAVATAVTLVFDPGFWAKNWELMAAAALVTMPGRVLKIGVGLGKLLVKVAGLAVREMVTGFRAAFPLIDGAVTGLVTRIITAIRDLPGLVSTQFRLVARAIGTLIGDWVRIAGSLAGQVVTVIGRGLARLAPQVVAAFRLGLDTIRLAAATWFSAAAFVAGRVLAAIRELLARLPNVVENQMLLAVAKIKSLATAAFSAAMAIGRAIIDGAVAGVTSLAGRLVGAVGDAVGGAIGRAKSLLDIRSPSGVFAGIGADTLRGFILGITTEQPKLEGKMAETVGKALERARSTVERFQSVFGAAFGKLGEFASRAFEAKTQQLLARVSARFDRQIARWQKFAAALTPAERALEHLDATEDQRSRDAALRAAQDALTAAEAMEAGVERERALAAAREQIRQAELANQRAALQAQAETERAEREKIAAAHIAKLEEAKARELQNLEERRRQLGEKLDEQLATLQERLAKHPEEYDKIQKRIETLLRSYGIPMRKSGELLGKAFARGLAAAAGEVEKSARALARIVQRYLRLRSPAEAGPMKDLGGWWDGLASALVGGINYRAVEVAAHRLAAAMAPMPVAAVPYANVAGGHGGVYSTPAGRDKAQRVMYVTVNMPHYLGDAREAARAIRDELRALDRVETGGSRPALT